MKKGLILLGIGLMSCISCKEKDPKKEGVLAINRAKLSAASAVFMKNNVDEVFKDNPYEAKLNYEFELGDYNNDGEVDLYAIKKHNTGTNAAEIHILNGATDYKSSLLKTQTALEINNEDYEFELGDYNDDGKADMYVIKRNLEESNTVEIHILNGASNFTSSLLKTQTVLKNETANYEYKLGDYNNDGKVDLYTFRKLNKETNFVEIHVLNGASNYTSSLLKTEAILNDGYEFNLNDYDSDGRMDLYVLKKNVKGTDLTEICVLSGASNYRKTLLKTEAILNEVNSNYKYQIVDSDMYYEKKIVKKQNRGMRITKI